MPSISVTRAYEAVYILDPNSSDDQIESITGRYKTLVETQGGEVTKVDVWERRKLAYPVKGRTEGIYVIMQFTGKAEVEVELRRIFQISEDQIRYLIVKQDENKDDSGQIAEPRAMARPTDVSAAAPLEIADSTEDEAAESTDDSETEAEAAAAA